MRWHEFVIALIFILNCQQVTAEPIQVTDDRHRIVSLASPAQRIVSLGPSMTELLFAIGAGDQVIAVDQASDYPAQIATKYKIPCGLNLDLEAIMAQRPDLIIVWDSGYQSVPLERLIPSVPLFYSEPVSLLDVAKTLRKFGVLTGRQSTANESAAKFEQRLSVLKQQSGKRKSLNGFYELWQTPLMSIGGKHVISDAMRLCGVHNIFGDSKIFVPHVEIETVLQRSPQVIITPSANGSKTVTAYWKKWFGSQMPPIIEVDDTLMSRHTVRILDAIEKLCQRVNTIQ